jgi:hypothetical protein
MAGFRTKLVDSPPIYPLAFGRRFVSCFWYGKQKCSKTRNQETEEEKSLTTQSFIHPGAIDSPLFVLVAPLQTAAEFFILLLFNEALVITGSAR